MFMLELGYLPHQLSRYFVTQ